MVSNDERVSFDTPPTHGYNIGCGPLAQLEEQLTLNRSDGSLLNASSASTNANFLFDQFIKSRRQGISPKSIRFYRTCLLPFLRSYSITPQGINSFPVTWTREHGDPNFVFIVAVGDLLVIASKDQEAVALSAANYLMERFLSNGSQPDSPLE